MTLWKINCMEDKYPGMWQRWFRNQCVAVGWRSTWGFPLEGQSNGYGSAGWKRTRAALKRMKKGDYIVASLKGNRVGRLGQITDTATSDGEWQPLVPASADQPDGEMGRRILVRWDMTVGPEDRDMVVFLPKDCRLNLGELRPTISEIRSVSLDKLRSAMNDLGNWQSLFAHFDYEKALSGYIATYPHRLEDGLTPHPDVKVREQVFSDRTRSDVVLLDRNDRPVIVECKQGQPTVAAIQQLRRYLRRLRDEKGHDARGILVHGGAKKLAHDVARAAAEKPAIEVVQHRLVVDFSRCN